MTDLGLAREYVAHLEAHREWLHEHDIPKCLLNVAGDDVWNYRDRLDRLIGMLAAQKLRLEDAARERWEGAAHASPHE